ncbi:MAG: pyruvate formate lyase family protein, partial [Actinobacteria bacterium]|nr:pyruvate formate lyase family protein [Actinomycetota bacterium]
MTKRVFELKKSYYTDHRNVCIERLHYFTESYKQTERLPHGIREAMAMKHYCQNRTLWIRNGNEMGEGELIVGSIASTPRGAPIYPEFAQEWIIRDLDDFSEREYRKFLVTEDQKKEILKLLEYWRGKTCDDVARERIAKEVPAAFEADKARLCFPFHIDEGIANTVVDYGKVINIGLEEIIKEIIASQAKFSKLGDKEKCDNLEAMKIACEAIIILANRYADLALKEAKDLEENRPTRAIELRKIAENCKQVPSKPARTFWEAVQAVFFVQLGLFHEGNSVVNSLGRMDQYLYPCYASDKKEGSITKDEATEIFSCFCLKLNEIEKLQHKELARFYPTLYQTLTIGGIYCKTGEDAANDVSYIILDAMRETLVQQPTVTIRWSPKLSEEFLLYAADTLKHGMGYPAFQGDPRDMKYLSEVAGKTCTETVEIPIEEVMDWTVNGCEESVIAGKTSFIMAAYFNVVKCLELSLFDGVDIIQGIQLGPKTGSVEDFKTMEDIWQAFEKQYAYWSGVLAKSSKIVLDVHNELTPYPFDSSLITDCI